MRDAAFRVGEIESKPYTRRPYAPFRTTTLQQEAGRKLGFTAQRTMSVAQDLYEAGFITYMRTDSVTLSDTAITAARNQVRQLFGPDYLPDRPRVYASKVKNAQEAHEAIRPAGEMFQTPAQTRLTGDQFRLYELIWMRTIASQMKDAEGQSITVKIIAQPRPQHVEGRGDGSDPPDQVLRHAQDEGCTFVASGRTITFHGFLKAYVEAHDESDDAQSDDAQIATAPAHRGSAAAAGVDHRIRPRDPSTGSLHRAVPGGQAGGTGDRPARRRTRRSCGRSPPETTCSRRDPRWSRPGWPSP